MSYTPPKEDYIQHRSYEGRTVKFEYVYTPKKNLDAQGNPIGVVDSMGMVDSSIKVKIDSALTNGILQILKEGENIDDFVYALTTIEMDRRGSKKKEVKLGQKSRYFGTDQEGDPALNTSIPAKDNEDNVQSFYNRESKQPYEFFTEAYLDKNIFDSTLLREALTNHLGSLLPGNETKVKIGFFITAFPFKTTVKKFGPIHLVFVNDSFNTLTKVYGTNAFKVVDQFFKDSPVAVTSPLLIYVFDSGADNTFIPYDPLSPNGTVRTSLADFGNIGRDVHIPSRSYFTNGYGDKTYNLSRSGAGQNLNTFTPLSVQKNGANSISGRNALIATYTVAKRLSRASITTKMMHSHEPGGIGIINFFNGPDADFVFLHEVLHAVTQYIKLNTSSLNTSKLLSNPLKQYTNQEKSDDYKKMYGAWSQSLPSYWYPSFNQSHPRPNKVIESDKHKLAMSTMIILTLVTVNGARRFSLVPVDISQSQSYGTHPLSTQFLSYAEMELLVSDGQTALDYLEANRPEVVYEFYMFAAAVVINEKKATHDISHFISKNSTYKPNLDTIKNTKSYAFLDLLNKGVDDLHTSFTDDISLTSMSKKFEEFKTARKKEYELTYEDFREGNFGLFSFLPLDGDFLKLNNSIASKPGDTTQLYQQDLRPNPGKATSQFFFNHQHPSILSAIGFKSHEETVDGKREGKIIEVYNGEPVQERSGKTLISGSIKKHRLIISRTKRSNISNLEVAHRKTTFLEAADETKLLKSLYGARMAAKKLAFLKTDGSGEEESLYVYVLVSHIDDGGNGKTDLDVSKKTITDDIGVSMDIE